MSILSTIQSKLNSLNASVKSAFSTLESKFRSLESTLLSLTNSHLALFLVLIVPLVILKWRSFLIDLLLSDSKKVENNAAKQDAPMAAKEAQYEQESDQAVQDAQKAKEASDNTKVDENWYLKK